MFHVNLSAKSFGKNLLLASVFLCSFQIFAQKRSGTNKSINTKSISSKSINGKNVNGKNVNGKSIGNRIDALIQRNRRLSSEITALNQLLIKQSNQILSQEGINNYYKSVLKTSRDSTAITQKTYLDYNQKAEAEILALKTALADTIAAFQEFRKQTFKERNRVVKDTNVVRVYSMPYDQVRVRVLRKILDEGIGLVIERNTDEGFLVSKVFKDRKSTGLFKKTLDTRVDCDIKMVQHPYEDNKTLFYATTRVQEKTKKDNTFIELTDDKMIKDYQKKLLKFFDDFLVGN